MRHLRLVAAERVWHGELERDGYLTLALMIPSGQCWHLTPFEPFPDGSARAYLAIDDGRVFYAQIGGEQ